MFTLRQILFHHDKYVGINIVYREYCAWARVRSAPLHRTPPWFSPTPPSVLQKDAGNTWLLFHLPQVVRVSPGFLFVLLLTFPCVFSPVASACWPPAPLPPVSLNRLWDAAAQSPTRWKTKKYGGTGGFCWPANDPTPRTTMPPGFVLKLHAFKRSFCGDLVLWEKHAFSPEERWAAAC